MRRRDFLGLAAATATALSAHRIALAQAQSIAKLPRIAYLSIPELPQRAEAFRQGLADYGYAEGRNITIDVFTAPTNADLPAFAARAVASRPDVIIATGTPASLAARGATTTIPIVFTIVADPVGVGLVANLARPGGNVTGNTSQAPGLVTKQTALIKEVVPSLRRLAVLVVRGDPLTVIYEQQVRPAAAAIGVEPIFVDFVDGQEFGVQFDRVLAAGVQAAFAPSFTYWTANSVRDAMFDLMVRHRLPLMSSGVTPGASIPFIGLVSYAADNVRLIRRSAYCVHAILKGTKPGDLAVEQPAVFEFALNLDTARKIGLIIMPSILAQATLVVDEDWRAPKAVR